jgi:hypothetical protein
MESGMAELADFHMVLAPVLPLRHRTSDLPSPLKSPVPTISQAS